MTERRLAAWAAYEAAGAPSIGEPPLGSLEAYAEAPRATVPSKDWPEGLQQSLDERGDEEGLIVQRDCTVLSRSMTKEQSKKGVMFMDLDAAVQAAPDLVRRFWAKQLPAGDAVAALNTAFCSGGAFLYVPSHVEVERPFHICYWMSAPRFALFPRTLIVAEAGSVVSLLDERLSGAWSSPAMSHGLSELVVRESSRVHHYRLENYGGRVHAESRRMSTVASSASLMSLAARLGPTTADCQLVMESQSGKTGEAWTARVLPHERPAIERLLNQLPDEPIREKLRHYIMGRWTGQRGPLTLEHAARWYPESRS